MPHKQHEEESIFGLAASASTRVAPQVVKYNTPGPSHGPKVKMHVDSSQVGAVLNPVRGVRDAQVRAGITPVNHARNNVLAVKEQSRLNALMKLQEEEEAAAAGPQRHYKRNSISNNGAGAASRGLSRTSSGQYGSANGDRPSTSSSQRNFVLENKAAAAAAQRTVKAEARQEPGEEYLIKPGYGQVPTYLLERKMELAAEQEALEVAREAALVPPGMRLLPEQERLETLAILGQNRREVERQLAILPIVIETRSQIRHKEQLEHRLHEIEEAWKIFSRSSVLVHAS